MYYYPPPGSEADGQEIWNEMKWNVKWNENLFITTDIYSISETNARHKYIGKSIRQ